ncbi:phosphate ABC transporter substrate-binding protein PstS [Polynucleobacter paneuropaeus]|nr:phosphate ABC transporter substrate-binding protein PstS [Polynucleobacter paneuropaeus]
MKFISQKVSILSAILLFGTTIATASEISGAGSSFLYPALSKWAEAYRVKSGNTLTYQSIGSAAGMRLIKSKAIDFGATDAPLSKEELDASDMIQFPIIIGGVVPVVNIDGVKSYELKLTGEILADIFMGNITKWNDKRIKDINPNISLPENSITVITRSDGSGTTAIFTNYLSKISKKWSDSIGFGATVKWPLTTNVNGKGNEGVVVNVSRIKNSIGYVEFSYAKKNSVGIAQVKNSTDKFIEPSAAAFLAASSEADWSKFPGMSAYFTNSATPNSWPISGAAYIVMHKQPDKIATAADALKFFDYIFKNGQQIANDLDYAVIPEATINFIRKSVWTQIRL